ncbi:MAG TPA: Sec-independent protein translocase protein TatB [Rudaea sp.]|jgi:sec-independent protein translocase protein TatB
MFDIGTGELALIAVVALLVLGPERLPKAARTAGALVRRARTSWHNVRAEIERELAAEELKQSIKREADQLDPRADISAALRDAVHGPPKQPPAAPAPSDERR